jgi:hypothetical protein
VVLNGENVKVAELNSEGTRGLNQVPWNLCLKESESPQPYFINYREYISAGAYTVQLETGDGRVFSQPWRVVKP